MTTQTERSVTSEELVAEFANNRRAAMNVNLNANIVWYEGMKNTDPTKGQQLAYEYAEKASEVLRLNQQAEEASDAHLQRFGVSARHSLRTSVMNERRRLQKRMYRQSETVARGSEAQKMRWFQTYCQLVANDLTLEITK